MIIIDVDDDNQDGDAKPSNLLVNRSSNSCWIIPKALFFFRRRTLARHPAQSTYSLD